MTKVFIVIKYYKKNYNYKQVYLSEQKNIIIEYYEKTVTFRRLLKL